MAEAGPRSVKEKKISGKVEKKRHVFILVK